MWYSIIENKDTALLNNGDIVELRYTLSLLDGTVCYTSVSLGPKSFVVGNGHVEYGLDEAMLYLHNGDKARIILPPHLAFGLIGDEDKIPPRSIVMYELEVINRY